MGLFKISFCSEEYNGEWPEMDDRSLEQLQTEKDKQLTSKPVSDTDHFDFTSAIWDAMPDFIKNIHTNQHD